ncbi:hypothetical protein [Chitinophaga sp.]|uniref:hypothetical protein n=1 Tax=Chitinophaga sp. TaxID=1869181 RepID=UPI0031D60E0C
MAIRKSVIQFEGKLEGFNSFLPKGRDEADGYIVRKNGGPSRKQIEKLPSCERVRRNNKDFGTCSSAAKALRMAISPVTHLADVNLAAQFTSLCRHLLSQDHDHTPGSRTVSFAAFGHQLSGCNLNRRYLFDSVVRHPLSVTLDRNAARATIAVPVLQPGVNLVLPWQPPLYRLIFSLGEVGDISEKGFSGNWRPPVSFVSPWYPVQQKVEESTVTLQSDHGPIGEKECWVVAAGLEMGTIVTDAIVTKVKHTGCGKILLVG